MSPQYPLGSGGTQNGETALRLLSPGGEGLSWPQPPSVLRQSCLSAPTWVLCCSRKVLNWKAGLLCAFSTLTTKQSSRSLGKAI